jgi:hypothetical protein
LSELVPDHWAISFPFSALGKAFTRSLYDSWIRSSISISILANDS